MHAYADGAATSLPSSETIANYPESWKLQSVRRKIEDIKLNHDDALAEPNIQRRAC